MAHMVSHRKSPASERRAGLHGIAWVQSLFRFHDSKCFSYLELVQRACIPSSLEHIHHLVLGHRWPCCNLIIVANLPDRIAAWLAEAIHLGTRSLPRDYAIRGKALAEEARNAGYVTSAARLDAWLGVQGEANELASFGDVTVWILTLMEDCS